MSSDIEHYDHTTITQDGRLIKAEQKPEDWAIYYHKTIDSAQWTDETYFFSAEINPEVSFNEARQAISRARTDQKSEEETLNFLEKMAAKEKRSTRVNLFSVK